MTKDKEAILYQVVIALGHEHEKTLAFVKTLENTSNDTDTIEALKGLALTIIDKELKREVIHK